MTSPQPGPQPTPSVFTPVVEGIPEPPTGPSLELREALLREEAELRREVILWQRWVRYVAAALAGTAVVLTSGSRELPLLPLTVISGAYLLSVFATAWLVQHTPANTPRPWLPALLVTADLIAAGAVFYVTTPPLLANRYLVLATMSVPLASFYFGWGLGVYAAVLAMVVYALIGRILPQLIPGPPVLSIPANLAIFGISAGGLTYTFGQFRQRMNQLRLFCKVVEEGDFTGSLALTKARYPDDLTLLARSFEAMRDGLAEQIGTDALTGALNRRSLEARLKAEWRLAKRRANSQLALAAVDLDHFKQINDTRGHPVGDIVLQQLAGIMKATARETDAVARFGGDEFVILLADTGWQGALTFAERLRRRVDDFTFGPPGTPMSITISVGVALAKGSDQISPEELLKEADRALYKAKQQGRNRVFA